MINLRAVFNLWKLKRSTGPSATFKADLHKDLSVAWDAKYGRAPWYQLLAMHKAGALAVVVLVLASGGGAYAYNSSEVTEGTALYPVKQAIENVEEITKVTPEARAEFYLKKIQRREAEKEVIKKRIPAVEKKQEEMDNFVSDINTNTQKSDIKSKSEQGPKVREESEDVKIQRTEKSIEAAEDELEKTKEILDKTDSNDIKLREELKNRMEQRLEKRKQRLEIKIEREEKKQKDQNDNQTEKSLRIKNNFN